MSGLSSGNQNVFNQFYRSTRYTRVFFSHSLKEALSAWGNKGVNQEALSWDITQAFLNQPEFVQRLFKDFLNSSIIKLCKLLKNINCFTPENFNVLSQRQELIEIKYLLEKLPLTPPGYIQAVLKHKDIMCAMKALEYLHKTGLFDWINLENFTILIEKDNPLVSAQILEHLNQLCPPYRGTARKMKLEILNTRINKIIKPLLNPECFWTVLRYLDRAQLSSEENVGKFLKYADVLLSEKSIWESLFFRDIMSQAQLDELFALCTHQELPLEERRAAFKKWVPENFDYKGKKKLQRPNLSIVTKLPPTAATSPLKGSPLSRLSITSPIRQSIESSRNSQSSRTP